ncbi:MAG TPA: hypothetical protein VHS81_14320 [Caulobacteraceae bacterium]|nr:hypothetical protein [Caulobacteraceae bacterium]
MSLHAIAQLHELMIDALGKHGARGLGIGGFSFTGSRQDLGLLGAIALLPLAVWLVKLRTDRWEASQRRDEARAFAIDVAVTLAKSIELCESVRSAIHTGGRVSDETVAAAIGSLDLSRRKLRSYLGRRIPLHELIPLADAAEKGLTEGCRAMLTLNGSLTGAEPDLAYARQLQTVRAELQSVADRLRRLEPDLGRAIAKVDAGWVLSD